MNYRTKANLTLSIVFIAFVASLVARHYFPHYLLFRLAYFVLEAALIGGIADWFAVTALFRKPLGFPFHTALIPRNREKVIQGVTKIVEGELLSKSVIHEKLQRVKFDVLVAGVLSKKPRIKHGLCRMAGDAVTGYLERLDINRTAGKFADMLGLWVGKHVSVVQIQQGLNGLVSRGLGERGLEWALKHLEPIVASEQTLRYLYGFLNEQKQAQIGDNLWKNLLAGLLESTDSLNLQQAAKVIQTTLLENIRELRNPAHPVRARILEIVLTNWGELQNSLAWQQYLENWKQEAVQKFPLQQALAGILASLVDIGRIVGDDGRSLASSWVEELIGTYWDNCLADVELRIWLDQWCRDIILRLLEGEHYLVGEIVNDTLSALSDTDLNKFVEDKAGNDLQWIRINGSIIGGAIGFIMFLLVDYIYSPLVVPVIQSWLR